MAIGRRRSHVVRAVSAVVILDLEGITAWAAGWNDLELSFLRRRGD